MEQDLSVTLKNGKTIYLNSRLIAAQNISSKDIAQIKKTHYEKSVIFDKMDQTNDKKKLKALAKKVTELEFKLQRLWGFEVNENYHEWYNVPKCKCPKADNWDMRGTEFKYYSTECPIHSVSKK